MDLSRLKHFLSYDPDTGNFTWLHSRSRGARKGSIAGGPNKDGYIQIRFEGISYYAHRLAWLFTHGKLPFYQIDHINGIPGDNRIANLREASHGENCDNARSKRDGLKGVTFHKDKGRVKRWQAKITHNRTEISLGYFNTEQEAHEAYFQAAKQIKGDFAHE